MGLVLLYGAFSLFLAPSAKKGSMESVKKSLSDGCGFWPFLTVVYLK